MRLLIIFIAAFVLAAAVSHEAYGATLSGQAAGWADKLELRMAGPAGPEITVHVGRCPGLPDAGGCWMPWSSEIWLTWREPQTFAHELAHAVDSRNLDDTERASLLRLLGYAPGQAWAPDRGDDIYCLRLACPLERFADVYAGCALGYSLLTADPLWGGWRAVRGRRRAVPWWGAEGWKVTRQHYRRTCRIINQFARTPA